MRLQKETVCRFYGVLIAVLLAGCESGQTKAGMSSVYPDEAWTTSTPNDVGLGGERWQRWLEEQSPQVSLVLGRVAGPDDWGAVVIKNGFQVHAWGDPHHRSQSASVGKAFTKIVLQLALDRGLVENQDDEVHNYWTGENQLTHHFKHMNVGYNQQVTFRHLWTHTAGFPITNGYRWKNKQRVPDWASWTGDPAADNYAHRRPGEGRQYSSGGYWRLTQALTAIWQRDLKTVLDDELFSHIGIAPEEWDWLPGKVVRDNELFYPDTPGYGAFVDPPFEINGAVCVGGGGWVIMSAANLARVGWLIANRGRWKQKQLISDSKLLDSHRGGNDSDLYVDRHAGLVMAKVTTKGLARPPKGILSRLKQKSGF